MPAKVIEANSCDWRILGHVYRRSSVQRSMNAVGVVVRLETRKLFLEIDSVPEWDLVEEFSSNRANQTLYERVRKRHQRYRLDFLDVEYPEIGFPPMGLEQRIVIGANALRCRPGGNGSIEHSADACTIHNASN